MASMEQSPEFSLPLGVGGSYPLQLQVISPEGCSDIITGILTVNELFNLFIPTSFTPNGDGLNDVFKIESTGLNPDSFRMEVFNRWGEKVFSSTDPEQVWTGGANGGDHYMPNGIYYYYISTSSEKSGERFYYKGYFTIVR